MKKAKENWIGEQCSEIEETASEILGKHRQKKKPWITAEILDLRNKRRELRKKRFEPEGSQKYTEMNNTTTNLIAF